jgi:hypothetical protein
VATAASQHLAIWDTDTPISPQGTTAPGLQATMTSRPPMVRDLANTDLDLRM